jgi:hypothetical protein
MKKQCSNTIHVVVNEDGVVKGAGVTKYRALEEFWSRKFGGVPSGEPLHVLFRNTFPGHSVQKVSVPR